MSNYLKISISATEFFLDQLSAGSRKLVKEKLFSMKHFELLVL